MILSKVENSQTGLRKLFHVKLYANSVIVARLYAKVEDRDNLL
jgi:hypothetical protein